MIKLRKGNKIVLGLSDENIRRLKDNQPIKFNMSELNIGDYDLFIIHGKTEESIMDMVLDSYNQNKNGKH